MEDAPRVTCYFFKSVRRVHLSVSFRGHEWVGQAEIRMEEAIYNSAEESQRRLKVPDPTRRRPQRNMNHQLGNRQKRQAEAEVTGARNKGTGKERHITLLHLAISILQGTGVIPTRQAKPSTPTAYAV